jgi:hypothetical protein
MSYKIIDERFVNATEPKLCFNAGPRLRFKAWRPGPQ